MQTRFELADVVGLFGAGLVVKTKLSPLQIKVLGKISTCRTAALGGHEEVCENCGVVRYSYNPEYSAIFQALFVLVLNPKVKLHFYCVLLFLLFSLHGIIFIPKFIVQSNLYY
jgi:hypothetical protein